MNILNVVTLMWTAGAFCTFWGFLWWLWDHDANAPGYIIAFALVMMLGGQALNWFFGLGLS